MIGRPPHGVSRQWAVVVRYGMRRATVHGWHRGAGIMEVEHTADCFGGAWFKSPLSTEV